MADDEDRLRQPRSGKGARNAAGGIAVGLAVLAAKAKALLALVLSFKWLFLGSKLVLSFGSMFLSIAIYAGLFGGLKIAVVFVLMILVHELGHYLTWRNFGVPVRLPLFIPLFGAFVSSSGGTPAQNTAAAIAGPVFGVGAAAACWGYGLATHETFWLAAAYIGFFLNFFNLLPIPGLDGGAIAGAIDARLWLLGIPAFVAWLLYEGVTYGRVSGFGLIFVALMAFYAFPRVLAVWRGQVDPRGYPLSRAQRLATTLAYFALALIAVAGAFGTQILGRTAA